VSRWDWLRDRPRRLQLGSQEDVLKDIAYCRQRAEIAPSKSHAKVWLNRQREAEDIMAERFGENAVLSRKLV
jgi:hypothetical protein